MAVVVLALAAGCGRKDPGRSQGPRPAGPEASDQPAVLATVPAEVGRRAGEPAPDTAMHSPVASEPTFTFGELGGGVAFAVEAGDLQRVIHNGKAGKKYAAVGEPAVSRDGRRCAYGALIGGKWRMVLDGVEGDGAFDAIAGAAFSLDGAHLAYQAMDGERWYLVVDGKRNQGTETRYLQHELSADGSRIAFLEAFEGQERGRFYVSDVTFSGRVEVAAAASSLVVSPDRTRVAAVEADADGARLVIVSFATPERVRRGARYRAISSLALGADDAPAVYVAERAGRQFAVLGDREEWLPEGHLIGPLLVRPGGTSVAALMVVGGRVRVAGLSGERDEAGDGVEEAEGLALSSDGKHYAYAARRGTRWVVVADGRAGPSFDRVVSPEFSPDGRFLVYRARLGGKRFVVVADASGRLVAQHPAYEQVFPLRFTSGGRAVAYGVKDGRQILWKVEPL